MAAPTQPRIDPPASHRPSAVLLGRPRWFVTLWGTDMWERFSFYGMTAILVLYSTESTANGGLGMSNEDAALLYGLYMASVFIASVPGGWIGDRVLGTYRAVLYGGILIGLGHLCMAVPVTGFFYPGLLLIALGTGMLKPNMAGLLSSFYDRDDRAGRDAGFAIFYMSVQVSALIAPIVVGAVGEGVNWHLGFGLAALGMAVGLIQYVRGARDFQGVGGAPERAASPSQRTRVLRVSLAATALVLAVYGADAALGTFEIGHVMALIGLLCMTAPVICFWRLIRNPLLTAGERVRVKTYIWLFLASAVFWALFLQGGSVFTLFAKESTDREMFGTTVPASWFHAAIPMFVLVTAPLFAWLWTRAGDRIPTAVKYAIGMSLTGAAYLVMALAALGAGGGKLVSPLWLILSFLLLAAGEVAFAPVGMSATTAVAPATFTSQMVSLFWLSGALGGGIGGNALKVSGDRVPGSGYFLVLGLAALAVGVGLVLGRRPLTRRLGV
ncbi:MULTISPECIES: oligopeptide:H+ symporter [unclassified Streptomyces]|uniref:peptide MFS transporter n=1 Tax=unclassified Streptomyces TaxID=2593676 RepID=UPI000DC7CB93|nr:MULTISPECIES: oligopeptide:H+ symporter [unclassified Streptomyces]AWZ09816.1 MFS transporter [Streptomyces sp. ICC4]AWZ15939.1 MFS transporter [Streptomyces sp. ICC1]